MGKAFMNRRVDCPLGDLHETPYSMTEQLLERELFPRDEIIIEPAAGNGAIKTVLKKYGYQCIASDKNYGVLKLDFLKIKKPVQYIITNPPYGSLTDDFVLHAKKICTNKFAFLLRTNYLSGQQRFAKGVYNGLRTVYVFNRMADLRAPIREDGKYPTAGIVYAWFVWRVGYKGNPQIKFIDNSMYVLRKDDK